MTEVRSGAKCDILRFKDGISALKAERLFAGNMNPIFECEGKALLKKRLLFLRPFNAYTWFIAPNGCVGFTLSSESWN